jgi:hypothetical protein
MDKLHIEATRNTPHIYCSYGTIRIEGKSLLPDPNTFFAPLYKWIDEYLAAPDNRTEIHLNFEYIDTSSVQGIMKMLRQIKEMPGHENSVTVHWYFEFDDPELLELGEIMEGRLGLTFNYIERTA